MGNNNSKRQPGSPRINFPCFTTLILVGESQYLYNHLTLGYVLIFMLHTVFLPQHIPPLGKNKKKKGLSVISCGLERNPAWKARKSNSILEQLHCPFSVFTAHQLREDRLCTRVSAFHRWVWQAQIIPFLVESQRKLQLRKKKSHTTKLLSSSEHIQIYFQAI